MPGTVGIGRCELLAMAAVAVAAACGGDKDKERPRPPPAEQVMAAAPGEACGMLVPRLAPCANELVRAEMAGLGLDDELTAQVGEALDEAGSRRNRDVALNLCMQRIDDANAFYGAVLRCWETPGCEALVTCLNQ